MNLTGWLNGERWVVREDGTLLLFDAVLDSTALKFRWWSNNGKVTIGDGLWIVGSVELEAAIVNDIEQNIRQRLIKEILRDAP